MLLVAPMVPGAAAAAPVPACARFALSPSYASDKTLVCTFLRYDGSSAELVLAVSKNAGRSWRTSKGSGLTMTSANEYEPVFSPHYRQDRTLFVSTDTGLHVSTNDGASWTVADPLLRHRGRGNPTPFVAPALVPGAPVGGGERVYAAYAAGAETARFDAEAGVHQPATGVLTGTSRFVPRKLADGTWEVLALGRIDEQTVDGNVTRYSVYRCTFALSCAEKLFDFPAAGAAYVWVGARDEIYVALAQLSPPTYELWRSTDGGRTFAPWRSVNPLLKRAIYRGFLPEIGIATNPAFPRRIYLRISGATTARVPVTEQVFRSDDAGVTWRRTGFQGVGKGSRGTLPWDSAGPGPGGSAIALGSDGRLFALGQGAVKDDRVTAVFCSTDGGYRWYVTCR